MSNYPQNNFHTAVVNLLCLGITSARAISSVTLTDNFRRYHPTCYRHWYCLLWRCSAGYSMRWIQPSNSQIHTYSATLSNHKIYARISNISPEIRFSPRSPCPMTIMGMEPLNSAHPITPETTVLESIMCGCGVATQGWIFWRWRSAWRSAEIAPSWREGT